ncbi:MAG: glutamine-hydrolyzing carbamoyl-phosphate synthase small subunit [Myxococcales bacterium]|nr:glutamine-hydrolyzing carbamoyl-phosphate synthase small subunit [Myxococcales bacterium]
MSGGAKAHLALADGTVFDGFSFGADAPAGGEVVFTTGMTGYQEVLTDPSYTGQIVTMTAPQIGNTGITPEDDESVDGRPQVAGFIVRDPSLGASNWRARETLDTYLARHGVTAIGGVDTRRLTRLIRDKGAQNGCIGTEAPHVLVERARALPSMEGLDLAARVTPKTRYEFSEGRGAWSVGQLGGAAGDTTPHVVAVDFGAKKNILRCLVDSGFRVTAVPASSTAAEILALSPDGIFLSSGPGDPAAVTYAVKSIRDLLGKKPIFGICLGHQLLALALGGRTYKLKFGHRGLNQPVKDLSTGRVEITTQNHGFVVDVASLEGRARSTHVHLNDGTSEGLEAPEARAFSVQYHPEAAAGPHDALYLFERFRRLMGA